MNDMEEMGRTQQRYLTVSLCDRVATCEVSGDYTLPDYQPEIRRLLWIKPTVLPPAKYVGGGQAELNGTVDYQLLYIGADGGLYTAPLSAEYGVSVPLDQMGEVDPAAGVTVFATTVCEGVTPRVSAPRKLSIRSRLRTHIRAFGRLPMEERMDGGADPASIRRLGGEAECMVAVSGVSDVIPVGDEINGLGEDIRVISADGCVFLNEILPSDGMVCGRGEVLLKLMTCREDGKEELLTRKLPVEGQVELDGMTTDGMCGMTGCISELNVSVEEDRILCEIGVLLTAKGMWNRTVRYTEDLYSTEVESECSYRDYTLPVALQCENGNMSQSERIPLKELNLPESAEILDVLGSVTWDSCEQMGGKHVLTGQSRYQLLCRKESDYWVSDLSLPLRYEMTGCEGTPVGYDMMGEVLSGRARCDGSMLYLDSEISVIADFVGKKEIRAVSDARFGEKLDCRGNRMVVYYPLPEDTSWTVAKRYHISPEKLSENASYYLI